MRQKREEHKAKKPEKQVKKEKKVPFEESNTLKEEERKPINDPKGEYPQKRIELRSVKDIAPRKVEFMDSKDMLKKTGKIEAIHPKKVKPIHPKKGK